MWCRQWKEGEKEEKIKMKRKKLRRKVGGIYFIFLISLSRNDFYLIFSLHFLSPLHLHPIPSHVVVFNFVIIVFTFIYFFNFLPLMLVYFNCLSLSSIFPHHLYFFFFVNSGWKNNFCHKKKKTFHRFHLNE